MNSGNLEKKNYRLAPKNESKDSEELDAMIVIPSYDEEHKILNTILSIVAQKKKEYRNPVKHGITVVINNAPNAPLKIKQNNFSTYLLLQALEHKFPINIKGNERANKKIKEIQDSNVPIHIIDAFSDWNNNENNNVGLARKIGTNYALGKVHDEGFIVSTDADTLLGEYAIQLTKILFNQTDYSALQYSMQTNNLGTTPEEIETYKIYSLSHKLTSVINERTGIEESISWMSGGGSAYKKNAFKKIYGYSEIPGEEDTKIGMQISDAGFKILDAHDDGVDERLYFSTRARVSERTSTGFGRTIGGWSEDKEPYMNKKVFPVDFYFERNDFLAEIEHIYDKLFEVWKEEIKKEGKRERKMDFVEEEIFSNKSLGSKDAARFFRNVKNGAIIEFGELCEKTFALDQKDLFIKDYPGLEEDVAELVYIFSKWVPNKSSSTYHHKLFSKTTQIFEKLYPQISIFEYLDDLEKRIITQDETLERSELLDLFGKENYYTPKEKDYTPKNYRDFEREIFRKLRKCGYTLDENNDRVKIKTVCIYYYQIYVKAMQNAIEGLVTSKQIEKAIQRGKFDTTKEIMKSFALPNEIIFLELQDSYKRNLLAVIYNIQNLFEKKESSEVVKNTKELYKNMVDEFNEFYYGEYKPIKEKFQPEGEKNIKILQKLLEIEEAKEKKKAGVTDDKESDTLEE